MTGDWLRGGGGRGGRGGGGGGGGVGWGGGFGVCRDGVRLWKPPVDIQSDIHNAEVCYVFQCYIFDAL